MKTPSFDLERIARRRFLEKSFAAMGYGLLVNAALPTSMSAWGETPSPKPLIGQDVLLKGLDGMSRAVIKGRNPFIDGHNAAAVIASSFFCQEQEVDSPTQKALLGFMKEQLFPNRIYQSQPAEDPDPKLLEGLVSDLHDGIGNLRRSGHNIIFAVLSLKGLRAVPEAATPQRIAGLREMVRSFRAPDKGVVIPDDAGAVDISNEKAFIRFVFKEYLDALDLYRHGKGHHGFAGHMLTVGHSLVELSRMGYQETAQAGMTAFWEFVGVARKGADRGGKRVADGPDDAPIPLDEDYWSELGSRDPSQIVSSHLIKYPYSFYALAEELDDVELRTQALNQLYHLTAIS